MPVKVLRSVAELRDVSEPWSALAEAAGARHNMYPYWCVPWWSHIGKGELFVAVVESGGQLAALAPLCKQRQLGFDTLQFIGSAILGVSEVLVAPDHEAAGDELWAFLLDQPRSMLDLHQHRLAGPGIDAFRRTEVGTRRAELGPASPFLTIAGSWADYWAGRRNKFRRGLERNERLAEREDLPVRVEVATDLGDIDKRLADVTDIFDAAERTQPRLNFMAGSYRRFTTEMYRRAAEQSRLALFVLYLGDRPVATSFTLRGGGVIGGGGLRFDHAYRRFSPGQVLFRHMLEQAFASGCTEFDFGPRDAPYKRQWSTGAYDTLEISAFSSDAVHALHVGRAALASRLARRVALSD